MQLPLPHTTLELPMRDGWPVKVRMHGNPAGPRLFILHGNGYASDAYFPFWRHFVGGFELAIFDLRNHGQNPPSPPEHHTFLEMTSDIGAVLEGVDQKLGKKRRAGVFHSVSGLIVAKAAKDLRKGWDAAVLVDPSTLPPKSHPAYARAASFEKKLVEFALSRRRRFRHIEDLAEELRKSRIGASWVVGSHELMARSILRQLEDGSGYELVCPPELEAQLYSEGLNSGVWPAASDFGGPALLIGADPTLRNGPPTGEINQFLADQGKFKYALLRECGHMMQFEQPIAVAELVAGFFREALL
jgi:pimeloyl-ACP methyl ester carboxylesterase